MCVCVHSNIVSIVERRAPPMLLDMHHLCIYRPSSHGRREEFCVVSFLFAFQNISMGILFLTCTNAIFISRSTLRQQQYNSNINHNNTSTSLSLSRLSRISTSTNHVIIFYTMRTTTLNCISIRIVAAVVIWQIQNWRRIYDIIRAISHCLRRQQITTPIAVIWTVCRMILIVPQTMVNCILACQC